MEHDAGLPLHYNEALSTMAVIESQPQEETFRLREYATLLWYRKWSILAITLVALVVAGLYIRHKQPLYDSTARVVATNPLASIQQNPLAAPNMDTERALVSSTIVAKCAVVVYRSHPRGDALSTADVDKLCAGSALDTVVPVPGLNKSLAVTVPQNTNLLVITYTNAVPQRAQASAQAFSEAYIWYKTSTSETYVNGIVAPLQAQEKSVNDQITKLNGQILAAIKVGNTTAVPSMQTRLQGLNNELQAVQTQLFLVNPSKISPPTVASLANLPTSPSSPNKPLVGAAGLFVGLMLGVGLAFLRERLDDRLHGRSDLENAIGAPVLAVIPRVPGWRRQQGIKLITLDQPKSATAEAYRNLRTSITFAAAQRGMKVLMVASPSAGEGKTTTAANLAVVLADAKKRVVLVSADLRKPRIHKFFGLSNDSGLSKVLSEETKSWEALQNPSIENLRIMASGPPPSRPAELLQSEQMGSLIAELRQVADFVILDTAPVLLVADALALVPLVDGVLFVSDADGTSRGAVAHAREQMDQVNAPVIGAILNNFDPTRARYYGYYYGYRGYRYRYGADYGYTYGDGEGRRRRDAIEAVDERERQRS